MCLGGRRRKDEEENLEQEIRRQGELTEQDDQKWRKEMEVVTETHETYLREWKQGKYALIVQEEGARSTG